MNYPFVYKCLCKTRSLIEGVWPGKPISRPSCEMDPDTVSAIISEALQSESPCMIARFGSTELGCVINYLGVKNGSHNPISYLLGKTNMWWWNPGAVNNLSEASGFFPKGDIKLVEEFCELFLNDIKHIDILGSWHANESYLEDRIRHTKKIFLPYLEPYWSKQPWTKSLKDKKVLVVHPFAALIEEQYHNHRKNLFANEDCLPQYELKTIQAVQSLGGENNRFANWFEALKWMEDEIDKTDYDVCIIGCGAYGLHLAAHIKRSGKKAIHIGGATQLLFGIKGNRWEDLNYGVKEWGLPYGFYPNLFNEYWAKPGDAFKPKNADKVENACYW